MMARLSLSLLGPFEVTLDGVPITNSIPTKARALLAYLAVEYGEGTQEGYLPLGTADAAGPYSHYPGEPDTYIYRVKFVQGNAESEYTASGLVILEEEYDLFLPLILRNAGTP